MSRATVFLLASLFLSSAIQAAELKGRGCTNDTGNSYTDHMIAKALAKGQLSHELGSRVKANTHMESITSENKSSIETTDKITESVTLNSEHTIERVTTLESGYTEVGGVRKYCVTVKI